MKIIHCLRTPLGGVLRHVLDLAVWQAEQGHEVGLITGELDEWPSGKEKIRRLDSIFKLGVHSYPISRLLDLSDPASLIKIRKLLRDIKPDIIHGHGAKGGTYARLAGWGIGTVFYTPHGGSLHYSEKKLSGKILLGIEKLFEKLTTGYIIFESEFARGAYEKKIGVAACRTAVVYNGLDKSEFEPVDNRHAAYDIGFLGELRLMKGVDVLLEALASWPEKPIPRCVIFGTGRDEVKLKKLAYELGIHERIDFAGPMPARDAFSKAKVFVVPSKAESLPYVVLELMAAKIPAVVTRVGGIPEIFGEESNLLIQEDNIPSLREAIVFALDEKNKYAEKISPVYRRVFELFRQDVMAKNITDLYKVALR